MTWPGCRPPARPICGITTRSGCSPSRGIRWSPCTGRAGRAGGRRWFPTPRATSRSGPGCARGRSRRRAPRPARSCTTRMATGCSPAGPGWSGAPLADETPGELTFTTLTKEALPLLRYRTGDIAALRPGSCPCGRTLAKMSKVTGRKDEMLVIRGVNVYPSEIERVLLSEPAVAPDYVLVIDERNGGRDLIACCERITARTVGSPC